jgi:hypothetical protein
MIEKMLRVSLTAILLLTVFQIHAQDYAETALLFSRNKPAGSARIQALGGAQTALGGDYSAALSNPAGLGMFNRSDFTFSLGLVNANTNTSYLGTKTDGNKSVFNIPGLSLALNLPKENGSFLGGSIGISMSRSNDFNRQVEYEGTNNDNSIIDYFIDNAFGYSTYQFENPEDQDFDMDSMYFNNYNDPTGLAYFNYLIGPRSTREEGASDMIYFTDADYPDQREEIITKGATNQWSFSYGANFEDKFYIGAGLGIVSLRYKSEKTFSEEFDAGPVENLRLQENSDMRGSGFNATIGAIVRPVDFLQIGISYKTPTIIGITETYEASMTSSWDNFDYYGDGDVILNDNSNDPIRTDIIHSEYNLTTPGRFSSGVTVISKMGFITADVEMINTSRAKYSSNIDGISFNNENDVIKSVYSSSINYRVGAEYRLNIWRIRAGYGLLSNTYKKEFDIDNKVTTVSAGFGFRQKSYYMDFALVHHGSKTLYQPYTFYDGSGPIAEQRNRILTGMVTVGFTF